METIAPGMTAPEGSVTIPLMEPALDWARRSGDMIESRRTSRHERLGPVGVRMKTLLRGLDVPRRLFFSLRNPGWSVPDTLCMLLTDGILLCRRGRRGGEHRIWPKSQFRIAVQKLKLRGRIFKSMLMQ